MWEYNGRKRKPSRKMFSNLVYKRKMRTDNGPERLEEQNCI